MFLLPALESVIQQYRHLMYQMYGFYACICTRPGFKLVHQKFMIYEHKMNL